MLYASAFHRLPCIFTRLLNAEHDNKNKKMVVGADIFSDPLFVAG